MKIILTSAIIAFCGILQIAINDATMLELRAELIEKEQALMDVTEPLLKLQKEILGPGNVDDTSRQFKTNLTRIINNATKAIEDKAEAAIANGKSVGDCVEPALANLTDLKKTAFAEYTQAGHNITVYTLDFLHQIDTTIRGGLSVATHVYAISTICYNNDTHIFAACVIDSMKNTTEGIEAYRTAANNILATAESETTSSDLFELALAYVLAVMEISAEAATGIETIQQTAIECIEAL